MTSRSSFASAFMFLCLAFALPARAQTASRLAVFASPPTIINGETRIVVQAQDADGNPLCLTQPVTVSLASQSPTVLKPYYSAGDSRGVVRIGPAPLDNPSVGATYYTAAGAPGVATVVASAPGLGSGSTQVTVLSRPKTATPPLALKLYVQPAAVPATRPDERTLGSGNFIQSTFVVQMVDGNNLPTTDGKRREVKITSSDPSIAPSSSYLFYGDAGDRSTGHFNITTKPGTATVTVSAPGLRSDSTRIETFSCAAPPVRQVKATTPPPYTAAAGSVTLSPGQSWSGQVRSDGTLAILARLLWEKTAGSAFALDVTVNGHVLTEPLLNKSRTFNYADGRSFPYQDPNSSRWMLFYSADFAANNGPAGGGYQVMTDRGQAYRYVWDIASLLRGNPMAQVQVSNNPTSIAPIEVRLEPAGDYARTTATPTPPVASAEPKADGWFERITEALKGGVAATTPSTPPPTSTYNPPSSVVSDVLPGTLRLAVFAVPPVIVNADTTTTIVVQVQDSAGRPVCVTQPVTITVASQTPSVLKAYYSEGDARGVIGLAPRVASAYVQNPNVDHTYLKPVNPGTATVVASAPGFASGSATVTVLPRPSGPGVPVAFKLYALPAFVPSGRTASTSGSPGSLGNFLTIQMVDAHGEPASDGKRFGATLTSSDPSVARVGDFLFYGDSGSHVSQNIGVGETPGSTVLRVEGGGLRGDSARLSTFSCAGGGPSEVVTAPVLPPSGTVSRLPDFGDADVTTAGRISNIVTAREVRNGGAIDITDRFEPDMNPIHVWFRISGFAPGARLQSRWTYLGGQQPLVIGTGEVTVNATNNYGTFNYELAAGKRWPAGAYRVEILSGTAVLGSAMFEVGRAAATAY